MEKIVISSVEHCIYNIDSASAELNEQLSLEDYKDIFGPSCPFISSADTFTEFLQFDCSFSKDIYNNFLKEHPEAEDGYYFDAELKSKFPVHEFLVCYFEELSAKEKLELLKEHCSKCPVKNTAKKIIEKR